MTRSAPRSPTRSGALQGGDTGEMLHGKVKQEEWWRFDGTEMASAVQGGKVYVSDIGEGHQHPGHGRISGAGIERRVPHRFRVVDRAGQR